jgi:hypothetical protein
MPEMRPAIFSISWSRSEMRKYSPPVSKAILVRVSSSSRLKTG